MNLAPTRKMPYRVGIHWLQLVLFSTAILVLSLILFGGDFREAWTGGHSLFAWFDLILLCLFVVVLIKVLFKRVVFADDEIHYYFFWIHRRYRYDELQSVNAVNKYNLNARFVFEGGESFRVALTYHDAGYLMEILKDRTPGVLPDLASLRDAITPRGLRVAR